MTNTLKHPVKSDGDPATNLDADIDLGEITRQRNQKETGVIVLPFPLADSDDTDVFDLEGTTRRIFVQGKKTGTPTQLRNFRNKLDTITDGDQNQSSEYKTSDTYPNGLPVKVERYELTKNEGKPNVLEYSIRLVESSP